MQACSNIYGARYSLSVMSNQLMFKDWTALQKYGCFQCKDILQNGVQLTCGHRLCKSCADTINSSCQPPRCPHEDCHEEGLETQLQVSLY